MNKSTEAEKKPVAKKEPISQDKWDKLVENGIDPAELGFRLKGESGYKNIDSCTDEKIVADYKKGKELVDGTDTWVNKDKNSKNYGYVMEQGAYCHKVAGQTEEDRKRNIKKIEKK
jgi:hypothetical protein